MDVIISGYYGRMGNVLVDSIADDPELNLVMGFDIEEDLSEGTPVCKLPDVKDIKADVVVDFSHFSAIPALMEYCIKTQTPVVVCTTALGDEEKAIMRKASETIPVFNSSNMSLGINLLAKMAQLAMPAVEPNFNVEIIEKHHNKKKDSPSGTAILLADAINEACEVKKDYLYGRHGKADEPKITDLGIHAIRGGTIPGEHTIVFAGPDEVIEITHTVYSRKVFATGALAAAKFLAGKAPGMYSMNDML